ncbi:ABC transporter ATP-binding protein [Nakamurella aerolata]|uniref:ABC transporter ATP-binding protein n=1 Tax=Nakamurella aerolata TaxID=1656892 RepID=A0A849A8C6_9ACTN|nr:ABC transporter ATP-binding protein [Nakamurella aerolata]NNG35358.1 ABC transporter ATP-binding protein [Nakamurella aerolata]
MSVQATTPGPDQVPESDTALEPKVESWRGVAAEDQEVSVATGVHLQARSRRLLADLLRPYKFRMFVLLLVTAVTQGSYLAGPLIVAYGIDTAIPALIRGDGGPLVLTTIAYLGAGVINALTRALFTRLTATLSQLVLLELRQRTFRHAQRLSVDFHEKYTSGKVISRLSSDVETLRDLAAEGLDNLANSVLSVLVVSVTLVVYDWKLGLVALAAFIPIAFLTRWYQRASQKIYRRTRTAIAATITQFAETMNGMRAVQAFRRESKNKQIFGSLNKEYSDATRDSMFVLAIFTPALRLIGNISLAVVMVLGAMRVIDGTFEIGALAAFALYVRRMYDPLEELAYFYNGLQSATAALEKISGLLEEQPSVPEPAKPTALPAKVHGDVRFDDVQFAYNEHAKVLPDIQLEIPAGQTVAVVGATGAGKSTLAKLLSRFYDPTEGTVSLDGISLDQLTVPDLRRGVVMVTQESFLFSGSVADNIALGKPDATRAEIEAAADAIGAGEFIRSLPEGFDTDVRKRGGRLSAGQRQLVAFARAFLADPAVLILDEATASLDIPSERAVQHALQSVLAGRTAVIIAHRLSTVLIADRVLVMEHGRIVEDGSPDELIGGSGHFAGLHKAWKQSLV